MNDWSTAERLGLGEGQVFLFQVWFGLSGSFRKGHRQHIGHIEVEDLEIDSLQMFYLASVPPGKSVDPQGDEYYLKTSCLRAHFWVLLPQCWAGTPELVSYLSLYAPLPRYFHPPKTFFFPIEWKTSWPGGKPSTMWSVLTSCFLSLLPAPGPKNPKLPLRDLQALSGMCIALSCLCVLVLFVRECYSPDNCFSPPIKKELDSCLQEGYSFSLSPFPYSHVVLCFYLWHIFCVCMSCISITWTSVCLLK